MALTKRQWKAVHDWLWWNHNSQSNEITYKGPSGKYWKIYKFGPKNTIIWQNRDDGMPLEFNPYTYARMDHRNFDNLKYITWNFSITKSPKTNSQEFQVYLDILNISKKKKKLKKL